MNLGQIKTGGQRMSKVTVRQLCELFKQITEKRVNEEAI